MSLRADDTIVACATAAGRGAIAIVRLSGGEALAVAGRVANPVPAAVRTVALAALHGPNDPDHLIDHALVTWFQGPHSYTGEDVVEFAVHGGAVVSTLVLEACVAAGARPALAGEFTERAVLHGKLDIVQAEAVADLIDARSRAAHRAAVRQLDGALSKRLAGLREALLHVDALLAYGIDFPEEDEVAPSRAAVLAACDDAIGQVDRLLDTLPAAALGRDGALVVLAGPPNVGKSSLMNALVGEARVLVSEIPGTTRDAVEVLVDDTPYPLRLVDTAGLRESGDALERMGIEVSERYVAQAHVVLACAEDPDSLLRTAEAVRRITVGVVVQVLTKNDTLPASLQRHNETQGATEAALDGGRHAGFVRVSALTGEGLDALRDAIREAVAERVAPPDEDTPIVTRVRHETALRHAGEELRSFRAAWAAENLPAPVAATHLRAAVTALESLIGSVDVDDILERVFRAFCIGK